MCCPSPPGWAADDVGSAVAYRGEKYRFLPVDKMGGLEYSVRKQNTFECCCSCGGWAENRKSGESPERYRHCMRGGCTEDESQSLGVILRRLVQTGETQVRRPAQMGSNASSPGVGWRFYLLAEKRLWRSGFDLRSFLFFRNTAELAPPLQPLPCIGTADCQFAVRNRIPGSVRKTAESGYLFL